MGIKFSNLASTTLASGVSSSTTSISVTSATSFPTLGSGDYFYASIGIGSASEVVKVTSISGTTFTAVRGQDSTTAISHSSGAEIALRVVAATLEDLRDATDNDTTYSAGTGVSLSGTTFSLTDTNSKLNLSGGTLTGGLSGTTGSFSGSVTAGGIALGDNDKATFGASDDLQIYHDGGHSYIRDAGTGDLNLRGDGYVRVQSQTSGTSLAHFHADAEVALYYNNSNKLVTTSTGIDVTGSVTADGIALGDNDKATFGASDDLQIYHDGNHSYIEDAGTGSIKIKVGDFRVENASGNNLIKGVGDVATLHHAGSEKLATTSTGIDVTGSVTADSLTVDTSAGQLDVEALGGSSVKVKSSGSLKLQGTGGSVDLINGSTEVLSTTSSGISVNGTATMDSLTVGNAGSDYALKIKEGSGDEYYQLGVDSYGGLVFYNETTKVAEFTDASTFVTQGDITVNGTATMDGLTVNSGASNVATSFISTDPTVGIKLEDNTGNVELSATGSTFNIQPNGGASALTIDSSGNVGIGVTPEAWHSNAKALQVGDLGGLWIYDDNSNPEQLHLSENVYNNGEERYIQSDYASSHQQRSGVHTFKVAASGTADAVISWNNALTIDNTGKVGIGISPSHPLHITKEIAGYQAYFNNDNGSAQGIKVRVKANDSGNFNMLELVSASSGSDVTAMVVRDDGNVSIGGSGYSRRLTLNKDDQCDLAIRSANDQSAQLLFGDQAADNQGGIQYNNTTDSLHLKANGGDKLDLLANGYAAFIGASDLRVTFGTQGTAGNNDSNWIRGNGNALSFNSAAGNYIWEVGGSPKMTLTSDGNLLVGKTATDNTTTGTRIHPAGYASFTIPNDYPIIANRLSSDGDIAVFRKDGSNVGSIGTEGGRLQIGKGASGLYFYDSGPSIIPWNIGSNSTADNYIDLGSSGNRFKDLYITGLDVTASTYNKISSYFSGSYTSGFKFSDMNGGIWYDAGTDDLTVSAGHANSQLILVSGGSEKMRIDSSGNVGIGTGSNFGKLSVNVSAGAPATSGNMTNGLTVHNTNGGRAIQLGVNESGGYTFINSAYVNSAGNSQPMAFFTGGSERMRIDSSGNVLINCTSAEAYPGATFSKVGGTGTTLCSNTISSGHEFQTFRYYNGQNGAISLSGTSGVTYATSSDYRLKENVVPMTGSIDRVKALKPSRFNFISESDRTVDGFLAHEAQEIVPECVTGTKDAMRDEEYEVTAAVYEDVTTPAVEAVDAVVDEDGVVITEAVEAVAETTESVLVTEAVMGSRSVPDYQGIDQAKLVPLLTAALQEAITQIESLTARIAALEE